ncbi:MAG: histidine phosphatase family protein [Methylocystis sp.]|uniref:histidine phosphatase family protein n=1 Tax=Methylocystis sp. TaxID=1911079 RepID=UPI003DA4E0C3
MTLLILARHGNTFEPGQQAVWVGARSDLPLTSKGREQAAALGRALLHAGLAPARTITGPLRRTRETASIAIAEAGGSPEQIEIDERLREIDYGAWEGKSSDDIRLEGAGAELHAWETDGVWPANAGWPSSREAYLQSLAGVLRSVRESRREPSLIVSSNGLFRLLAGALAGPTFAGKMATGRLALLRLPGEDEAQILGWNLSPDAFPAFVAERL